MNMDKELLKFQKSALLGEISGEPLCQKYKQAWRMCGDDKEMLMRLALHQQSQPYLSHACYENLGVTKEYILKNFGKYINGKKTFDDVEGVKGYTYQMYVDFSKTFTATSDVTGMMWCDGATAVIEKCKCPTFYVSNGSNVHFSLDGFNSPRIYLFDESVVTIDDGDKDCEVIVYKYSNRAEVKIGKFCLCNVKIFNKQLKL